MSEEIEGVEGVDYYIAFDLHYVWSAAEGRHISVPVNHRKRPLFQGFRQPAPDRGDKHAEGGQIIADIAPYKPVAADLVSGKRPVIGGRRQHREFLKRNGYIEVGNESQRDTRQYGPRPGEIAAEVKRVIGE